MSRRSSHRRGNRKERYPVKLTKKGLFLVTDTVGILRKIGVKITNISVTPLSDDAVGLEFSLDPDCPYVRATHENAVYMGVEVK